jgi:hypothetical protein
MAMGGALILTTAVIEARRASWSIFLISHARRSVYGYESAAVVEA